MSKKEKMLKKYCGYCADGHLHWITPEGATKRDSMKLGPFRRAFETNLFEYDYFAENSIQDFGQSFIGLPPTHCPRKTFRFLDREQEAVIPDNVAPFDPKNEDYTENPTTYLLRFENPPGAHRFERQTELQCKKRFHELIGGLFCATSRELKAISYSDLTQKFLRKFWSYDAQEARFQKFENEVARKIKDEISRQFLNRWALAFEYGTIRLSRDIIHEMKKNINQQKYPAQFLLMDRYKLGVTSWLGFYEVALESGTFRTFVSVASVLNDWYSSRWSIVYMLILQVLLYLFFTWISSFELVSNFLTETDNIIRRFFKLYFGIDL